MDTNSTLCIAPAPVNSVAGRDAPIDVALLLRAAIEGTGCQHKVAADAVGYQPDYLSRVLGNERGIIVGRLGQLPVDVQKAFVTRWAGALGILPPPGYAELVGLADLIATKRVRVTIEATK